MDANAVTVRVDDREKTLRFAEALVAGSVYAVAVEGGAAACGTTAVLALKVGRATVAWAALTDGAGELSLLTEEMRAALAKVREGARVPALAVLRCTDAGADVVVAIGKADVLYAGSEWFETTELNRVIATGAVGPKGDKGDSALVNFILDDLGRYWRISAEANADGEMAVKVADAPEEERPTDLAAAGDLLAAAEAAVSAAEEARDGAAEARAGAESARDEAMESVLQISEASSAAEEAVAAKASAEEARDGAAEARAGAEEAAAAAAASAAAASVAAGGLSQQEVDERIAARFADLAGKWHRRDSIQITKNSTWANKTFAGLVGGGLYTVCLTVAPVGTTELVLHRKEGDGASWIRHPVDTGTKINLKATTGLMRWRFYVRADAAGNINLGAWANNRIAVAASGRVYVDMALTGMPE